MARIPKNCIYPSSILLDSDIPPISGGFSIISFHNSNQYPYKIARKTVIGDISFHQALFREFANPYSLKYPTILRPFGIINPKDSQHKLQILSEYKSGGTLWNMILKEKTYSHPRTWNATQKSIVFYGIVKAVDFINKHGFMHLDLKADNILLDENLEPFLIDFTFLSKIDDKDLERRIQGNPLFQPPESRKKIFHVENDWYGLGILRYQMEELDNPYSNEQDHIMWQEKETGKKFSSKITSLTAQLLNPDPKQRPSPEFIASLMEKHFFLFEGTDNDVFDNFMHKLRMREHVMFKNNMSKHEIITAAMNGIASAQYIAYHLLNDITYLINAANQNSILAKTELKLCLLNGNGIAKDVESALKIPSFIIDDKTYFLTKFRYPDENIGTLYNLSSEANDAYLFAEYKTIIPGREDALILYLGANIIQESSAYDVRDLALMYLQSYQCGFVPAADKIINMMNENIIQVDLDFILDAASKNSFAALQWLLEQSTKGEIIGYSKEEINSLLNKIIKLLEFPLQRQFLVEYFYKSNQYHEAIKLLQSSEERTATENYIYSLILNKGIEIAKDPFESLRSLVISVLDGCEDAVYEIRSRYSHSFFYQFEEKEGDLYRKFYNRIDNAFKPH